MNTKPRTRTAMMSMRLNPQVRSALNAAAAVQNRSTSNLTESVLVEWLTAKGFLKSGSGAQSRRPQTRKASTRTPSGGGSRRAPSRRSSRRARAAEY